MTTEQSRSFEEWCQAHEFPADESWVRDVYNTARAQMMEDMEVMAEALGTCSESYNSELGSYQSFCEISVNEALALYQQRYGDKQEDKICK
jgi:hypothetical protein